MRHLSFFILTFFILSFSSSYASGNFNFFLGHKKLDSDDWSPCDSHLEAGFLFDYKGKNWPLSISLELFGSSSGEKNIYHDNTKLEVSTAELGLGFKKIWEPESIKIKPFIGASFIFAYTEIEVKSPYFPGKYSDDGSDYGFALSGGFYFTLDNGLNLGVLARYSKAEVSSDYDSSKLDVGGTHLGGFIGYNF